MFERMFIYMVLQVCIYVNKLSIHIYHIFHYTLLCFAEYLTCIAIFDFPYPYEIIE